MATHRLYRYTSIGRPLDPAGTLLRILAGLAIAAALLGALTALVAGSGPLDVLQRALLYTLAMYGSWALARELDPDDTPAAFISVAAAVLALFFVQSPGILLLYVTLILVRMVNRSSGLPARQSDSIVAAAAAIGVMYATGSPYFCLVAALAFVLDGSLKNPLRRQWVYGLVCAGATLVYMVDHKLSLVRPNLPDSLFEWISLLFILIFALDSFLVRKVRARGDVNGLTLDVARVRGGMAVGFLAALQGVTRPDTVVLVVAVIAGLCIGMAFRKGFKTPPS